MDASTVLLFVDGGAIGLRTAVAATEPNARLNIAFASKVYSIRSHGMSAERGAGTGGIEFLG
jgi:succinate dehydrogenase/fumarate reductase flavoprotein subunit